MAQGCSVPDDSGIEEDRAGGGGDSDLLLGSDAKPASLASGGDVFAPSGLSSRYALTLASR
jgi:hypothetical protein